MDWQMLPALFGAAVMTAFGVSAALRPRALEGIGVEATSPLGTSEIRAVFGGMFIALGLAAIVLREPVVFAVVGAAWLGDVAVRLVAVFVDHVPKRQAFAVLAAGSAIGLALLSGYWLS